MAASSKTETGIQLLARLGSKPSLSSLEPLLFPQGGPQPKDIIELYGESGSGRTQCLLHLTAKCILPETWRGQAMHGLGVGVIFLDNDYHFSLIRLVGILESRITDVFKDQQDQPSENDVEDFVKECLGRLHVVKCNKSSQFVVTLQSLESLLSNSPNICILMIDSISAFYWMDRHSGGDSIQLQEYNLRMACECIEKLVSTYSLVVIACKAALFQKRKRDNQDNIGATSDSSAVEHCEYLCKAWQKLVAKRYIFTKLQTSRRVTNGQLLVESEFCVSSGASNATERKLSKNFIINDSGLVFQ